MKKLSMQLYNTVMSRTKTVGRCRIWTGAKTRPGYGNIKWEGKNYATHRVVWEMNNGPIPKGMWLRHRCGHRDCLTVEHMWVSKAGKLRKELQ